MFSGIGGRVKNALAKMTSEEKRSFMEIAKEFLDCQEKIGTMNKETGAFD